jgi:hypothetical protein
MPGNGRCSLSGRLCTPKSSLREDNPRVSAYNPLSAHLVCDILVFLAGIADVRRWMWDSYGGRPRSAWFVLQASRGGGIVASFVRFGNVHCARERNAQTT